MEKCIVITDATGAVHEQTTLKVDNKKILFVFRTKESAMTFVRNERLTDCSLEEREWSELLRAFRENFGRVAVDPKTRDSVRMDTLLYFMVNNASPCREC